MGLSVRENNTMIGSYHSHSQTARKKLKNEIAYTPYLKVVGIVLKKSPVAAVYLSISFFLFFRHRNQRSNQNLN